MLANRMMMASSSVNQSLIDILTNLSLTANLELCLDAGDSNSYTSGQKWLDRSGNGYDFFLGADNSVTTDDPTFNGVAGRLSANEYFSFDGGDFFRYDTINEAWMSNVHKDNATFTHISMYYHTSVAADNDIQGTAQAATDVGHVIRAASGDTIAFIVVKGAGGGSLNAVSSANLNENAWNFIAVSWDEDDTPSNASFININGNVDTFAGAYISPSAAAATFKMEIGAGGNAGGAVSNGTRLGVIGNWSTNLSQANIELVRAQIEKRFGL